MSLPYHRFRSDTFQSFSNVLLFDLLRDYNQSTKYPGLIDFIDD